MIEIKRMTKEDTKELADLEKLCFSSPWTQATFTKMLDNTAAVYFVARYEGCFAGYVGAYNLIDEFSIINIATVPHIRNKGIATALIEKLQAEAISLNVPKITLEVRESNHPARSLYEKAGFTLCGTQKNYYSSPKEDAALYTKTITEGNL